MKFTLEQVEGFIDEAVKDDLIQSSRRLIFTHCNEGIERRRFYFADTLYNFGGTGVLIKFEEKFFLLTAQHVIDAHYTSPQNESPFFTNALVRSQWDGLHKLLYPIRGWKIGSLINSDIPWIDDGDVALIELGQPIPGGYPECYIDLDSSEGVNVIREGEFYEGWILLASGYPIDENLVEWSDDGKHDYKTNLRRSTFPGFCVFNGGKPYVEFKLEHSHADMNGVSGGVVTNVPSPGDQIGWAGMIQKAGNGNLWFYPAYLLYPAIMRYRESPSYVIDPAANLVSVEYQSTPEAIQRRKEYNLWLKNLQKPMT